MPPTPVRLLIVDDDPLVLSSLRLYFGSPAGKAVEVAGEASTGQEAIDFLASCGPEQPVDVVMADIHMPGMDGVALLEQLRGLPDPPAFVAMTALDEEETMLSILAKGGKGYILKSSRPEFIIDSVLAAVSGGTVVSPQPASRLVQHLSSQNPNHPSEEGTPSGRDEQVVVPDLPELPHLSASEEIVLSLLCNGLSNAEISRKTGRSGSAVKKQVSHLLGKFGATTRVQLAVSAIEAGFHPDDIV